jgi:hypothetical protein
MPSKHRYKHLAVRNKNAFIAFLTFSDIYVCFTLFALQTMVQRIPDVEDISVPTWQPPPLRSRPVLQCHHGHRQGHQRPRLATILLNLAKPS